MRLVPLVAAVVLGLLLIAVVLPSKRDRTMGGWRARIRHDVDVFIRLLIAIVLLAVIVWYVVRLFAWR